MLLVVILGCVFLRVHYTKQCIQHVCALMLQKRMSKKGVNFVSDLDVKGFI